MEKKKTEIFKTTRYRFMMILYNLVFWLINNQIKVVDFPDSFCYFVLLKPVQVCQISVVLPLELWQVFRSLNIVFAFCELLVHPCLPSYSKTGNIRQEM